MPAAAAPIGARTRWCSSSSTSLIVVVPLGPWVRGPHRSVCEDGASAGAERAVPGGLAVAARRAGAWLFAGESEKRSLKALDLAFSQAALLAFLPLLPGGVCAAWPAGVPAQAAAIRVEDSEVVPKQQCHVLACRRRYESRRLRPRCNRRAQEEIEEDAAWYDTWLAIVVAHRGNADTFADQPNLVHVVFPRKERLAVHKLGENAPSAPNIKAKIVWAV